MKNRQGCGVEDEAQGLIFLSQRLKEDSGFCLLACSVYCENEIAPRKTRCLVTLNAKQIGLDKEAG